MHNEHRKRIDITYRKEHIFEEGRKELAVPTEWSYIHVSTEYLSKQNSYASC